MAASPFDTGRFSRLRAARGLSLGEPIAAVGSTDSTNDDALEAARAGAPHGALFVADEQRAGRGRRGHRWTSPPGVNLTASLLLRPTLPPERLGALPLVVGLAVRALSARHVSSPLVVKWPNDVLAGSRKLAGVLVEARLDGAHIDALVVGVGLNLGMRDLPPEIAEIATSLALLGAAPLGREEALVELLAELEPRLAAFERGGLEPLLDELRAHDGLLGARVIVGDVSGVAAGIDADGALLLEQPGGEIARVTSGTVQLG
ncbi:MAG: biotin--[acetyl-CoA-carboxylase] ligase [Deltaproteobacteria bacterium]|nr:biotin--[acetyl-CoA-carboxylase] ligase [Deltaproteobacteria bacterium]